MAQKMLRLGSEGSDVQCWQNFLIGQGHLRSGRVRFHRHAEQQLKAMWAAWEQAGLLHLVLSYEGSYNPPLFVAAEVS
ncbi:MAG: hypothetical protein ACI8W7_005081 [Gammaproteobacteria bacterium]|jgi:hypothetical protein